MPAEWRTHNALAAPSTLLSDEHRLLDKAALTLLRHALEAAVYRGRRAFAVVLARVRWNSFPLGNPALSKDFRINND
jgi:hypothetical protein